MLSKVADGERAPLTMTEAMKRNAVITVAEFLAGALRPTELQERIPRKVPAIRDSFSDIRPDGQVLKLTWGMYV
jgi:hypothetical protein